MARYSARICHGAPTMNRRSLTSAQLFARGKPRARSTTYNTIPPTTMINHTHGDSLRPYASAPSTRLANGAQLQKREHRNDCGGAEDEAEDPVSAEEQNEREDDDGCRDPARAT